jgi:penicillin-binding protein 2
MLPSLSDDMPMFHRRLLILALAIGAGVALPVLRTCDLTLRRGEDLRKAAEGRLVERRWVGTTRGQILDRKGRVLARDQASFDLEVDYPLISGQWAFTQAAREARRKNLTWTQLNAVQREQLVQQYLPGHQQRLADAWAEVSRLTGVSPAEIDARRDEIIQRVSAQALAVWESQRRATAESLARGRELTSDEPVPDDETLERAASEIPLAEVARPIREQRSAHVIVSGVSEDAAFAFPHVSEATRSALLPGMRLVDATSRVYPGDSQTVRLDRSTFPGLLRDEREMEITVDGVMTPIVGWMRNQLFREDLERRPLRRAGGGGQTDADGQASIDLGGYMPGDSVGAAGLESKLEDDLRGLRGSITEQLDTGQIVRVERTPGQDVRLTIDSQLQARILALMGPQTGLTTIQPWQANAALAPGTRLNAAAVVLDIDSGDVLAMVSTPTFTRTQLRDEPDSIFKDEVNQPLLNRALGRAYAPGSIVKPLVFAGAVARGVWEPSRTIACNGHFVPDKPDQLRCWIFKQNRLTHNQQFGRDLTADEALMVSCNIYFYALGQRLGGEGIARVFNDLGVGNQAGVIGPELGLGYQFGGSVGRMVKVDTTGDGQADTRPAITSSEATLMGIGQGPIAWTPLHAADTYATLARGGVRVLPRVRASGGGGGGGSESPPRRIDLRWDPSAVQLALQGLHRAVSEERGTGHHITTFDPDGVQNKEPIFNVPGLRFYGKSGTADSGLRAEQNPDASLDHAWFVVMAGPEFAPSSSGAGRPKVVVAVLVEFGGGGGRVAGPLANQILWALRAEGYL